jgi:hypothetical protein
MRADDRTDVVGPARLRAQRVALPDQSLVHDGAEDFNEVLARRVRDQESKLCNEIDDPPTVCHRKRLGRAGGPNIRAGSRTRAQVITPEPRVVRLPLSRYSKRVTNALTRIWNARM